jgi:hypothetical protein
MYSYYKIDSKELFSLVKSQNVKYNEIENYMENLLKREGLFYNDSQRKKLLLKLQDLNKSYIGSRAVLSYIKKKLEEYK